jgi:ABC-type antimicrobial peptide transport system permease subunit
MAIPISYNLRSLAVRRTTTVLTVLGIALTVAVFLASLALINGLRDAFQSTGAPLHILVLRKGCSSELGSMMPREVFRALMFKPGIARDSNGQDPLASQELVTTVKLVAEKYGAGGDVTLRGLLPVGIELRHLKLREGRWFQPGQFEGVVGRLLAHRYPSARVGRRLRFGKGEWTVVGVMEGGRTVVNSEIFADLNQVASQFNRPNLLNSILLRVADPVTVPAMLTTLNEDQRLNVTAQTEKAYYDRQAASGLPLLSLGLFVSIVMAVGSSFAAMNTMYAAVSRRVKEVGTLRVLGFSRSNILLSFLMESLLLSFWGGLIGGLLVLPLNYVTSSVGNLAAVSETLFTFQVGPSTLVWGILFALLIGALGGLLPARMAARKEIMLSLRGV